jgi:uncharacterized membrane protein YphA (DoxX/SURF4 family)
MNAIAFFSCGVALALVVAFSTIAVIRKNYREIVEELCGTPERAGFWVRTSEVCLVVITLFAAITFHGFGGMEQPDTVALFWGLMGQLTWVLAAIFLSMMVISLVILRSLPHQAKRIELPHTGLTQGD